MTPDVPVTDEMAAVYSRMSGMLLAQETVQTLLGLVTELAHTTIPASTGCAMSLLDDRGRRTTTAATDAPVARIDDLQYDLDEGPCMTAWRERCVVRVDDTRTDGRWQRWAASVQDLGVRAALSAPLLVEGRTFGAMKVYSDQPDAFGPADEGLLVRFGVHAATLLANMQTLEDARKLSDGLKEALTTRDVIATAKGVLMARDGVDDRTAFAMLVSVSQREHVKLRDAAATLLAGLERRRG